MHEQGRQEHLGRHRVKRIPKVVARGVQPQGGQHRPRHHDAGHDAHSKRQEQHGVQNELAHAPAAAQTFPALDHMGRDHDEGAEPKELVQRDAREGRVGRQQVHGEHGDVEQRMATLHSRPPLRRQSYERRGPCGARAATAPARGPPA